MRTSADLVQRNGEHVRVVDGFDYHEQAWVRGGVYQPCAHPATMRPCCSAWKLQGATSLWHHEDSER